MHRVLVFVPVNESERLAMAGGGVLRDRRAFLVTDELMKALDYGPELEEDAEYAAMTLAAVAGLTEWGVRIVLVAEVEAHQVERVVDADNGEVYLEELNRSAVRAFFADESGTDLGTAAAASRSLSIDQAWERSEVQEILATTDLLWHGAEELAPVKPE